MTIAERLRQEGRHHGLQEGIRQGLEQGLEQGVQKGTREEALRIARMMLDLDIDRETVLVITGFSVDDVVANNH